VAPTLAPAQTPSSASGPSDDTPLDERDSLHGARALLTRPWALALASAIPLTALYLALEPPSGDLAAASYRSEVFARSGFTLWDNGWYGGHYLPGYSVLAPALGALAGERLLLGLCTIATAVLFALIAQRVFGLAAARVAAVSFALGACVTMLSGRVAFSLGLAVGLLAVLALMHRRPAAAVALGALTSLCSPVAGAFLALAGLAHALARGRAGSRHGAAPGRRGGAGDVDGHSFGGRRARARTRASASREHIHPPPRSPGDGPHGVGDTHHSSSDGPGGVDDGHRRLGDGPGSAGDAPRRPRNEPGGTGDADRWPGGRPRLREEARLHGLSLAAAALTPIVLFALAFPEGGYEPFAASVFWPGLAGVTLIALALPRLGGDLRPGVARALASGVWLYALALIGSYALRTPVGSNAARLGELFAAPLVAGVVWEGLRQDEVRRRKDGKHRWQDEKHRWHGENHLWHDLEVDRLSPHPAFPAWLRHPLALAALALVLLYWQLETPLNDLAALAGDPSVNASYYAPLLAELQRRAHGEPLRVEVPQTGAHWESAYLPEHGSILLARGWERQLDTRDAALFYGPTLTASTYQRWLTENAVSYVALPDIRLDFAGEAEGRLIARGLPYLREVWRSPHWRLYVVAGAPPLAQAPAQLVAVGADSFTLAAPRTGSYEVRLRFTPYWALQRGDGCVRSAPNGWTTVQARAAGTIRVGIDFSLARVFSDGQRCA
jgi:hypothetical protein